MKVGVYAALARGGAGLGIGVGGMGAALFLLLSGLYGRGAERRGVYAALTCIRMAALFGVPLWRFCGRAERMGCCGQ